MIQVRAGAKKGRLTLSLTGHAGYKPGNDPVCAAASMLAALLPVAAERISGRPPGRAELAPGRARVALRDEKEERLVFHVILLGLRGLADNYPEHVKMELTGLDL